VGHFCHPDPDPGTQINADPDPQLWMEGSGSKSWWLKNGFETLEGDHTLVATGNIRCAGKFSYISSHLFGGDWP